MDLRHEFTVPAPIDQTWSAFNDIEMPCSPHRVWSALQHASSGSATPTRNPTVDDAALPSHNAATSEGGES